jgi:hypothetical protein
MRFTATASTASREKQRNSRERSNDRNKAVAYAATHEAIE